MVGEVVEVLEKRSSKRKQLLFNKVVHIIMVVDVDNFCTYIFFECIKSLTASEKCGQTQKFCLICINLHSYSFRTVAFAQPFIADVSLYKARSGGLFFLQKADPIVCPRRQ